MWWLPAVIGGIIKITGNAVARGMRARAADEAIQVGQRNLVEGQNNAEMNANQMVQDNNYILALSGVRNDFGTPQMLEDMTHNAKSASVNRMARDYEEWAANVRKSDTMDAINTGFNITGDVFSTLGQLYYDHENFLAGQDQKAGLLSNQFADNPGYAGTSYNIKNIQNPGSEYTRTSGMLE